MAIDKLLEEKRAEIKEIAGRYGVTNIRVFGSMARGDATTSSDVDLLVDLGEHSSLLDRIALIQELEDLLGRKVDLVTRKSLHWYIRDKVLKEAVPL
jgi:predicted nucleotidyltransferase